MYLNPKKLRSCSISGKCQLVFGLIFILVFGNALIAGFLGDETLAGGKGMDILFILLGSWMIAAAIKKRKNRSLANSLNQAFIADADGILPIKNLFPLLDTQNEGQAANKVRELIRSGYLCNLTFEQSYPPTVKLFGKTGEKEIHTVVECPHCGAKVEKRVGYIAPCPYCKSSLQ